VICILGLVRLAPSVVVRFKSAGSAPVMKQNFYKITGSNRFQVSSSLVPTSSGPQSSTFLSSQLRTLTHMFTSYALPYPALYRLLSSFSERSSTGSQQIRWYVARSFPQTTRLLSFAFVSASCPWLRLTFTALLQFTYINSSFSPAPDDTVANLYKVSRSRPMFLPCATQGDC
jgi:hypothetical protein